MMMAVMGTERARAAAIVEVYITTTPQSVIDLQSGTLLNQPVYEIPQGTTSVYASLVINADDNLGAMIINSGNFTVQRDGAATVGPISFAGGVYPGTSPTYSMFNASGNLINLGGQTVAGSSGDTFVLANLKINIPTVDQVGEQMSVLFGGTYTQNSQQISWSQGAVGLVVVPEPNPAALTAMGLFGLIVLRQFRRLTRSA